MTIDSFSPGVSQKLGYYVYRLIDPRNGETFYVGKGWGDRVFQHAAGATKLEDLEEDEDKTSLKMERIAMIKDAGLEVIHVIHRHDIPKEAVFEVEAAVIDAYPGLSNIQGGHGSGARGPMSVNEIEFKYALPELGACAGPRLVLINVNGLEANLGIDTVYDQVRYCWRISPIRASKADCVLAVRRGIVIGAFTVNEWLEATKENFPEFGFEVPGRWGFHGSVAPPKLWNEFVGERGKRVTEDGMKHIQNPIRYWNI